MWHNAPFTKRIGMSLTQTDFESVISEILKTMEPYKGSRVTGDSPLLGALDSLALVGMLVDVERYLEETLGHNVSLTEELLASTETPLATVRTFAHYLETRCH